MNYELKSGDLSVSIDDTGAQLRSIRFRGHEYLWQGDPAYWEDQSPLLFPFVGRFTEGSYTYEGETYHLPIHGFARSAAFTVAERTDRSISFCLEDSPASREVYPCAFRLTVTYALQDCRDPADSPADAAASEHSHPADSPSGRSADRLLSKQLPSRQCPDTLTVRYRVENRWDRPMHFGIGGHPGFSIPLEEGLTFADYRLTFSRPCIPTRIGHTPACFLSGKDAPYPLAHETDLPLAHGLFDEDAIVLKDMADTVTLHADGGSRSVTLSYAGMPYLGLWHAPRTAAPYLCIEPWTSLPSRQDIVEEFTCKSDLIRLAPGELWQGGWTLRL